MKPVMYTRNTLIMLVALLASTLSMGQDGDIAYANRSPMDRIADNNNIGFTEGVIPGVVDLQVPEGTHLVDLLDAHGNVRFVIDPFLDNTFDLGRLRSGIWSLRAHSSDGIMVRRFVLNANGSLRWISYPRLSRVKR